MSDRINTLSPGEIVGARVDRKGKIDMSHALEAIAEGPYGAPEVLRDAKKDLANREGLLTWLGLMFSSDKNVSLEAVKDPGIRNAIEVGRTTIEWGTKVLQDSKEFIGEILQEGKEVIGAILSDSPKSSAARKERLERIKSSVGKGKT